jgi:hypothetical protein
MNKLAFAACIVTLLSVAPALSQNAPPGNPTNTGFMAQQPGDRLASRLVGLNLTFRTPGMRTSAKSTTSS